MYKVYLYKVVHMYSHEYTGMVDISYIIYGISYTYVYDVSARSIFIDHVNNDFVFIIFGHIAPDAS